MKRKYMLHSGYVLSVNDGEAHFIPATRLIELYHLSANECVIEPRNPQMKEMLKNLKEYIHLYPHSYGNYDLPKEQPHD
jgi:hypothetical protein